MVVADTVWRVEDLGTAALNVSTITGLMNTSTLALAMLLQVLFAIWVYISNFHRIAEH